MERKSYNMEKEKWYAILSDDSVIEFFGEYDDFMEYLDENGIDDVVDVCDEEHCFKDVQ